MQVSNDHRLFDVLQRQSLPGYVLNVLLAYQDRALKRHAHPCTRASVKRHVKMSRQTHRKITRLCGSKLPASFEDRLNEKPNDADWQKQVGIEQATDQVRDLVANQAAGLHFYVLNKSESTEAILSSMQEVL